VGAKHHLLCSEGLRLATFALLTGASLGALFEMALRQLTRLVRPSEVLAIGMCIIMWLAMSFGAPQGGVLALCLSPPPRDFVSVLTHNPDAATQAPAEHIAACRAPSTPSLPRPEGSLHHKGMLVLPLWPLLTRTQ
jgi:hypothetical protein